jgi:thiamine biosynthesis protein ThiS
LYYVRLDHLFHRHPRDAPDTMQITVNGTPTTIPSEMSMAQLLEHLELAGRRLAVEVNRELVPRSRFESHLLRADDRVEIIHAVGGG